MKLTDRALIQIMDKTIRAKLSLALNVTDQSIVKYIGSNKNNGPLTTVAALKVIKKETGLSEKEILEEATESAVSSAV